MKEPEYKEFKGKKYLLKIDVDAREGTKTFPIDSLDDVEKLQSIPPGTIERAVVYANHTEDTTGKYWKGGIYEYKPHYEKELKKLWRGVKVPKAENTYTPPAPLNPSDSKNTKTEKPSTRTSAKHGEHTANVTEVSPSDTPKTEYFIPRYDSNKSSIVFSSITSGNKTELIYYFIDKSDSFKRQLRYGRGDSIKMPFEKEVLSSLGIVQAWTFNPLNPRLPTLKSLQSIVEEAEKRGANLITLSERRPHTKSTYLLFSVADQSLSEKIEPYLLPAMKQNPEDWK